ncbi:MAG: EH signature domain-containing protein [Rhodospirillaceae bacterium]
MPPGWQPKPAPFPGLCRTAEALRALNLPEIPVIAPPAPVDREIIKDRLDQFFEVVEVSVPAYQSRMWAERRQYWLSYLENQSIIDCRVVFGRRGAALARQMATREDNQSLSDFADFSHDPGIDPNQAVLLMKFCALLVADWSHSGRCYIWLKDNPAAPVMNRNEYLRSDLMSDADFETPHNRNWQNSVDDFIAGPSG